MYLLEADGTLNKDLWYFIQQIDGVISIAGSRNAPLPMRKREVEDLLPLLDAEAVAARPKVEFAVGDPVRVCEGPFQSQEGTIEEIDPEKGKLRVSVSIFGRATPVDLEYWQVEKA
ncbi:transcription termination/antitermination protein NusG [Akkermansia muciniphila]